MTAKCRDDSKNKYLGDDLTNEFKCAYQYAVV